MSYIEALLHAAVFSAGVFMFFVALGASFKTVQWIGKRLNVKPFDLP